MSKHQRIIITGFMGSGKTTLAKALARRLNCRAVDLDQVITGQEQRAPREIIEEDGECAFRDVENRALRDVLQSNSRFVLSLGGGAWTLARNRELIACRGAFTVWLDTSFEVCWKRILAAGSKRPLAHDKEQARTLYETRRPFYEQADLHLDAGGDSGKELAVHIEEALGAGKYKPAETHNSRKKDP
jgi:shikimate kinase